MHRRLATVLFALLPSILAAGAALASGAACPVPPDGAPRQFLHAYHLQITGLPDPSALTDGGNDYQLDESLIGGSRSTESSKQDNSPVALADERDLAALQIRTDSSITPYIGAGVSTGPEDEEAPGLSSFEAAEEAERQSYQLGAGLDCELSNSARLNLGYRYSAGNLPEISGTRQNPAEPAEDHNISFGLKLDF